jgi:hypothetical protein
LINFAKRKGKQALKITNEDKRDLTGKTIVKSATIKQIRRHFNMPFGVEKKDR